MGEPEYVRRQREEETARRRREEEEDQRKQRESEERYRLKLENHARDEARRAEERRQQAQRERERSGGTSCFAAETLIATPSGPRPIGDLREGDEVLSLTAAGRIARVHVRRHLVHAPARVWSIQLAGRTRSMRVTGRHLLRATSGWVRASRVVAGDRLTGLDGVALEVLSVEPDPAKATVYNIHVGGEGTFIADGCVVHCFIVFRRLRVWWLNVTARGSLTGRVATVPNAM